MHAVRFLRIMYELFPMFRAEHDVQVVFYEWLSHIIVFVTGRRPVLVYIVLSGLAYVLPQGTALLSGEATA